MKHLKVIRYTTLLFSIIFLALAAYWYQRPVIKEVIIPAGEYLPAFSIEKVKDYFTANYLMALGAMFLVITGGTFVKWSRIFKTRRK
jgi:hypothetical protein